MDKKLLNKILKRKDEGTLRSLSSLGSHIDFYSNDYLGLAQEFLDIKAGHGSTGSRLISGTYPACIELEKKLATFFNAQEALLFNSGYDANIGFFSSIPLRNDTVIYDELIHASVRDGIRLGFANGVSFKHNNLDDLEDKLLAAKGVVYVAIESLYSMDGDLAPLVDISSLCEKHGAYLVIDEAHSGGVYGEEGKGLVAEAELENKVFARLVTFGKAYGSHGACVLGSDDLKTFLLNFARSFIYTTALPPISCLRISQILDESTNDERRNNLEANIKTFREAATEFELLSAPNSPIQIIKVGGVDKTRAIASRLQRNGLAVKPIYSPTVMKGDERLRICIHAFNTQSEIELLFSVLNNGE